MRIILVAWLFVSACASADDCEMNVCEAGFVEDAASCDDDSDRCGDTAESALALGGCAYEEGICQRDSYLRKARCATNCGAENGPRWQCWGECAKNHGECVSDALGETHVCANRCSTQACRDDCIAEYSPKESDCFVNEIMCRSRCAN